MEPDAGRGTRRVTARSASASASGTEPTAPTSWSASRRRPGAPGSAARRPSLLKKSRPVSARGVGGRDQHRFGQGLCPWARPSVSPMLSAEILGDFFNRLEGPYSDTSIKGPRSLFESVVRGQRFAEDRGRQDRVNRPIPRAVQPSVAVGTVQPVEKVPGSALRGAFRCPARVLGWHRIGANRGGNRFRGAFSWAGIDFFNRLGRLCDRNVWAIIPCGLRFRAGSTSRLEIIGSKLGI